MKTYEVNQTAGILLNANESPYPLPASIREEIKARIDSVAFHRYPEDSAKALCDAYANYSNIKSDQIMFGNGSDEMIGLLISIYIQRGKRVYTMQPDFSMYDYYTAMHEGIMIPYRCDAGAKFSVSDFIAYGKQNAVDLILFSNPNNPTGRCLSPSEIHQILDAFSDIPVIIDEAYGEFAQVSVVADTQKYDHLIVLRTLSKAFGIAALRCGCMITNAALMKRIRTYKVPYNVNSLTQMIAEILLSHHEIMEANVKQIIRQREQLYEALQAFTTSDFTLYPSHANFLYGITTRKRELLDALKQRHIQIRNYENNNAFRITIGTNDENALVKEAFAEVFPHKEVL